MNSVLSKYVPKELEMTTNAVDGCVTKPEAMNDESGMAPAKQKECRSDEVMEIDEIGKMHAEELLGKRSPEVDCYVDRKKTVCFDLPKEDCYVTESSSLEAENHKSEGMSHNHWLN